MADDGSNGDGGDVGNGGDTGGGSSEPGVDGGSFGNGGSSEPGFGFGSAFGSGATPGEGTTDLGTTRGAWANAPASFAFGSSTDVPPSPGYSYGVTEDGTYIQQRPDGSLWSIGFAPGPEASYTPYSGTMPTGTGTGGKDGGVEQGTSFGAPANPDVSQCPDGSLYSIGDTPGVFDNPYTGLSMPLNPDKSLGFLNLSLARTDQQVESEMAAFGAAFAPKPVPGSISDIGPKPAISAPTVAGSDGQAQSAPQNATPNATTEPAAPPTGGSPGNEQPQAFATQDTVPIPPQNNGDANQPANPLTPEDLAQNPFKRTIFAAGATTWDHLGKLAKLVGNTVANFMDAIGSLSYGAAASDYGFLPAKDLHPAENTTASDALRRGSNSLGDQMQSGVADALQTVRQSYQIVPPGFGEQVAQVFTEYAPFFAGEAASTAMGGPAAGTAFGVAWFGANTRESLLRQGATDQEATLGGLANGVATTLAFMAGGWGSGALSGATGEAGARMISTLTNALVMQASPFIDATVQAVTQGKDVTQAVQDTWDQMQKTLGRDFLVNLVTSAFMSSLKWTDWGQAKPSPVEENIRQGNAAMDTVIKEQANIQAAMNREGLGEVSFYYGVPGNPNKNYAGGSGVAKIIATRTAEGADGEAVARKMVEVIALGDIGEPYGPQGGTRRNITYDGHTAVLSLWKDGEKETWLLTGWDNYPAFVGPEGDPKEGQ